jgi:hypothetical protein
VKLNCLFGGHQRINEVKTNWIKITCIIYDPFWDLSNHNLNFILDLIDGAEEKGWK